MVKVTLKPTAAGKKVLKKKGKLSAEDEHHLHAHRRHAEHEDQDDHDQAQGARRSGDLALTQRSSGQRRCLRQPRERSVHVGLGELRVLELPAR